jgi:uncharacterized RDD family membrane protein YckC
MAPFGRTITSHEVHGQANPMWAECVKSDDGTDRSEPPTDDSRTGCPMLSRTTTRLAGRRVVAWVIDWLIISVYAAALVPVGLLLAGHSVHLSAWGWNAVAFVILIVPVTVWLAAWESTGATPGKHAFGLRVRSPRDDGAGWRRALARNALKVALPWELGHTATFLLTQRDGGPVKVALGATSAILAYGIATAYVVSLFIRSGRTPYDHATATYVNQPATRE